MQNDSETSTAAVTYCLFFQALKCGMFYDENSWGGVGRECREWRGWGGVGIKYSNHRLIL